VTKDKLVVKMKTRHIQHIHTFWIITLVIQLSFLSFLPTMIIYIKRETTENFSSNYW